MKKRILFLLLTFHLSLFSTIAQTSDSILVEDIRENGITFTHENSVKLLMSGKEKFADMFEKIRQAKSSIHMEYFNFRNDSIANLLFDILRDKRKEGVEVRCLFDGFGNDSNNQPLKKEHLQSLHQDSIDIHEFDPIRFPWVNHIWPRDHRKIVVIDGEIGYTGGMNVADYYLVGTEQVGEWRDMHCRIEGPPSMSYKPFSSGCGSALQKKSSLILSISKERLQVIRWLASPIESPIPPTRLCAVSM